MGKKKGKRKMSEIVPKKSMKYGWQINRATEKQPGNYLKKNYINKRGKFINVLTQNPMKTVLLFMANHWDRA